MGKQFLAALLFVQFCQPGRLQRGLFRLMFTPCVEGQAAADQQAQGQARAQDRRRNAPGRFLERFKTAAPTQHSARPHMQQRFQPGQAVRRILLRDDFRDAVVQQFIQAFQFLFRLLARRINRVALPHILAVLAANDPPERFSLHIFQGEQPQEGRRELDKGRQRTGLLPVFRPAAAAAGAEAVQTPLHGHHVKNRVDLLGHFQQAGTGELFHPGGRPVQAHGPGTFVDDDHAHG